MLNIEKLKTDLKETAAKIVELKKIFRESGQPRLWPVHYRDMKRLKWQATLLCAIKAHSHGKLHLMHQSLDEQWEMIDAHVDQYQKSQAA